MSVTLKSQYKNPMDKMEKIIYKCMFIQHTLLESRIQYMFAQLVSLNGRFQEITMHSFILYVYEQMLILFHKQMFVKST